MSTPIITALERAYTQSRPERRDRNRRRRWQTMVNLALQDGRISRGCVAWLARLAERSSDTAKPVWGMQVKQAAEIRCSDRQVRRYRAEAEKARLIETRHGAFERRPDGTCGRTSTNLYLFCVPPGRGRQKPSSHRADIHGRGNQSLTGHIETFGSNKALSRLVDDSLESMEPFSSRPPGGFEALRALLNPR